MKRRDLLKLLPVVGVLPFVGESKPPIEQPQTNVALEVSPVLSDTMSMHALSGTIIAGSASIGVGDWYPKFRTGEHSDNELGARA